MTHSHDTSTPAMSAETVPSEEFVLVPKEFLDFLRHAPVGSGTCCCGDEMEKHSDPMSCGHSPVDMWDHELDQWLKQIATLSASHLAKEGGEAGAVERAAKALYEVRGVHRSTGREWEAAFPADRFYCIRDAEAALASLPQPSPALAKGGDAVREALEREGRESYEIGKRDGYEEAVQHIDQRTGGDGEYCCVVGHDADDRHCPDPQSMIARIVERFEALSTPTEGPISSRQTNAATHDVLDEAKINALPLPLIARFAGDKDWLPIHDIGVDAPLCRIDVSGKLEPRRFSEIMELKDGDGVIHNPDDFYLDTSTPTEGPAAEERFDYLSDAQARELFGTEDDDELPDGRVRVCAGEWVRIPGGYYFDASAGLLHPETASEACDGCAVTITPTEGPASQTEGMGGDAKKLRENIEAFLEMHRRGVLTPRTPNIPVQLLEKSLAALTPPETAEAVPDDLTAAYMAGVERGREEAARLREDLEREIKASVSISETLIETRRLYRVEKLRADDAVRALETARAATTSDPTPATDDRECVCVRERLRRDGVFDWQIVSIRPERITMLRSFGPGQKGQEAARAALATEASR